MLALPLFMLWNCASSEAPVPAAPTPPAECPTTAPAPSASIAVEPPSASSASSEGAPAAPPGQENLLWSELFEGGDVFALRHPDGIALVPSYTVSTVEGTTISVLDPAGLPRWQKPLGAVGAATAAVNSKGQIAVVAVDQLNWPKTPQPYEQRRVLRFERDGRRSSFSLPSGISASSIAIHEEGEVSLAGEILASSSTSGQELRAFLLQMSPGGQQLWRHDQDGELGRILPVPGKRLLVTSLVGSGASASRRMEVLDAHGKDLWSWKLACSISSLAVTAGAILVTAPVGCMGSSRKPDPPKEDSCELHRLALDTGKVLSSLAVPSCLLQADEAGMVAWLDESSFAVLDSAGRALSTQSFLSSRLCFQGSSNASLVLTPSSVFLSGSCPGERIGTMFNSPYARASARSTTYLARYARK